MSEQIMCACGRPLHYNSPEIRQVVEEIIEEMGEEVKVVVGNRSWMVPRHYIALHGLKAQELPTSGFPEVR